MSSASLQEADIYLMRTVARWELADPDLSRSAYVVRQTFDQLYDGQHTGRYRWDQLFKTEKTHFGTLLEINLRREFDDIIEDGVLLDYRIAGHDIDCKYSQTDGGWMVPPEAFGRLLLVVTADDAAGTWSLGMVRASEEHLRPGRNRDGKTGLNAAGRAAIVWIARHAELPPNVLQRLSPDVVAQIFSQRSGQARVNELLRLVTNQRIGRNTIATVAQQDDFMKRVRYNGGARSALAPEGYIIPGGDYEEHRRVAERLGAEVPQPGEVVSLRVDVAYEMDNVAIELDGRLWKLADDGDAPTQRAPMLPQTHRSQ